MKKIKVLAIITIVILVIIAFENWENKQIEKCVNAGNSKEFCEVKLGN